MGKLFDFLLLVLISTTASVSAQQLDQILAVVSGQVVLRSDVRAFLELGLIKEIDTSDKTQSDQYYVTKLIERQLALDEVNRYRMPIPTSEEIDRELAAIRGRLGGESELSTLLALVGLGVPDLKQILQDDIRTAVYVSERFGDANQLSESELISYFDDNRGRFAAPDRTVEFDEVREAVRMKLWAERREMLVGDWLTGLMRRGEVVRFEP